jgi:hypothetical protein
LTRANGWGRGRKGRGRESKMIKERKTDNKKE